VLDRLTGKRPLDEGLAFSRTMVSEEGRHQKPGRLGVAVTEEVAGPPVPAGHGTTGVEGEDGVVGGIEDGGQERFAVGCNGARMLGDGANLRHEPTRRPPYRGTEPAHRCCRRRSLILQLFGSVPCLR
jgi:hypothetical protein